MFVGENDSQVLLKGGRMSEKRMCVRALLCILAGLILVGHMHGSGDVKPAKLSDEPWVQPSVDMVAIKSALYEKGKVASIDVRDSAGFTGLMRAAQNENVELVELLLAHGAQVNLTSNAPESNQTALHLALQSAEYLPNASPRVVQLLIEHGADPLIKDKGGIPAVHGVLYISRYDLRKRILDMLLRSVSTEQVRRQLINTQNNFGDTMLHMMIQNRDRMGIEQFLHDYRKLIDPKVKNKKNQTAFDVALQMNIYDIVDILADSGLWGAYVRYAGYNR